ncbi:MAG: sortase, partial [Anaerolineales bacterium]
LTGVTVYLDLNNNGSYDASEPTTTSDATTGAYSFTGLAAGTYHVRETNPANYTSTGDSDGTANGNDHIEVTLVASATSTGNNFFDWQTNAVISDFVWNDTDGDGVQDTGEGGIAGVRVFIDLDGDNTYDVGEPTDVTDANGLYSIENLPAGTYSVLVATSSLPAGGYVQTYDPDSTLDNETSVSLSVGQTLDTVDFGYQPQAPGIRVTKSLTAVTFNTPQEIQMTYSILVENTGNVALSSIQVTDDLATTFTSADAFSIVSVLPSSNFTTNSSFNGSTDTNLLDGTNSLTAGASGTITLVVLVDTGGRADIYTNTAIAQGTPPSGPNVQDSDSIPGPSFIDPALTKAVDPAQAAIGDVVTFTITLFNNGNVAATGVEVTDILPDNLDYVSSTSIDTATSLPRGTITVIPPRTVRVDNFGPLDVTDVIEITIVTRVNSLGQPPIQNEARLIADPPQAAGVSPDPTRNNVSAVALQIVATPDDIDGTRSLPATGFAPGKITSLPDQAAEQAYTDLGNLWLEIPKLGVKTSIVGVPKNAGSWNVDWLWEQAGWLEGTAFPTWQGNSVLTGHVYLSNGKPGPFIDLSKLRFGEQVIVHAFGQRYIYEVRTNHIILPDDLSVLKHEERAWLTLLTCKGYEESNNSYKYRIETRAILIKVEAER